MGEETLGRGRCCPGAGLNALPRHHRNQLLDQGSLRQSRRAPSRGVDRSLVLQVVPGGLGGMWQRLGAIRRTPQAPPGHPRSPAAPRAALRATEKTRRCSPPAARAAQSQMHAEPTRDWSYLPRSGRRSDWQRVTACTSAWPVNALCSSGPATESRVDVRRLRDLLAAAGVAIEPVLEQDAEMAGAVRSILGGRRLSVGDRCCLALTLRSIPPDVLTEDRAWADLDLPPTCPAHPVAESAGRWAVPAGGPTRMLFGIVVAPSIGSGAV